MRCAETIVPTSVVTASLMCGGGVDRTRSIGIACIAEAGEEAEAEAEAEVGVERGAKVSQLMEI